MALLSPQPELGLNAESGGVPRNTSDQRAQILYCMCYFPILATYAENDNINRKER